MIALGGAQLARTGAIPNLRAEDQARARLELVDSGEARYRQQPEKYLEE